MEIRSQQEALFIACEMEKSAIQLYTRALMLLDQHTAAEAAALCGRPQKTVEAQVYRAKKMLAETIRQERRSEDGMVSG